MKDNEFTDMLWGTVPSYMDSDRTSSRELHEATAYVMGARAFVANVIRWYIWTWSL